MATGRNHRPATSRSRGIPDATVARLPLYLRALTALSERSVPTVSSEELASAAGVNSAKLRKDFSYLGSYGTRGVGYDVEYLVYQISRELGLTQDWPVVIVGIGNLGAALANYGGFASRGFRVAALIDADPAMTGKPVAGIAVQHSDELERVIEENGVSIGVIATPAASAQPVADRLVAAGVTSILNFAPTVLSVPEGVDVRKVDLSIELQILAFHEQRKSGELPDDGRAVPGTDIGEDAGGGVTGSPVAPPAASVTKRTASAAPAATDRRGDEPGNDGDLPAVMPA
ncbi:redox-sensing transcriptional repressor Rex [Streptomyces alkaliterrae]|uniref:Redox-sensing transcriptional repressor Rex n=1 Tax=Streptomyces alkaliterrae TaxID=2213162 RepID=A0A5P0YMX9_9ACTN|nr:redox-sensing transcriptional repressor Rex [Streptomyces alkaliterrae]MBB1252394.1 redox-sensing transcriptional repressor Rex [Streptomyces alkaliterrae]MBB1259082.1 redox-sensing transcriptional repressor Rex [Streptomyces alkaliterrae]MQS00772.1 redox-sensing transcriptional repressor Rex [Streptomyces alkaliterrae]